jgi:UDPglucose 6-dehydrogenase
MNVVVIGTGYVGLTTGLGLAKLGHKVVCVDKDAKKISQLDLGHPTFYEPDMEDLLKDMLEGGRVLFTTELSSVTQEADVFIVCVGTPPGAYGEADLSAVEGVADELGNLLRHDALVVMKSTVPVGTTRRFIKRVRQRIKQRGLEDVAATVKVADVPEFLREGSALRDFFNPDRIVIGADDPDAFVTVDKLYKEIEAPRLNMSIESAELTKYAANALLATKISFINEIANIAERTGGNVEDIAKAVGMDHRVNDSFLGAGIGWGGSCFPKDVTALHQLAGTKRYNGKLLSAAIEVNNRQRELFFERFLHHMNVLRNRRIGVWGLAFKGGTDDVRRSPAIDIVREVVSRGAHVTAYDPKAQENAKKVLPESVEYAPTAVDAITGTEALLVLTDWDEFRQVSFKTVHTNMLDPRIFDGRNLLVDKDLETLGFQYVAVGM